MPMGETKGHEFDFVTTRILNIFALLEIVISNTSVAGHMGPSVTLFLKSGQMILNQLRSAGHLVNVLDLCGH